MFEKLYQFDSNLIDRFEKIGHWTQIHFGKDNFFLAKIFYCISLFCCMNIYSILTPTTKDLWEKYLLFFLVVLAFYHLIQTCLLEKKVKEHNKFLNPERNEGFSILSRIIQLALSMWATIYLLLVIILADVDTFIIFLFIYFISDVVAEYFNACSPLPPSDERLAVFNNCESEA